MSLNPSFSQEPSPRLLVIDDDEIVRKNICAFLEDCGFGVLQAESGKVGLELFDTECPDLVLCDLRLPDMDGLDVIRTVTSEGNNTPVIVISGYSEIDDVVQALRLGAIDYLLKPIEDLEVLEHSAHRGLKQSALIRENAKYSKQLEHGNQQLRQSLDLLRVDQQAGRLVQTRLLPDTPYSFSSLLCKHKIVPSLYLSGDFVDYWRSDSDELIFYIADVSGHGASSAFVTVLLKYLAKDISQRLYEEFGVVSPGALLSRLNGEIGKADLQKHVTAFIGILDATKGLLRYSAAGHYPMPIIGDGENYQYLDAKSFSLGIREDANYEDKQLQVSEKFSINLFSDGVLELLDLPSLDDKEEELLSIVKKSGGHFEGVFELLGLSSVSDAPDDIALLTIEKTSVVAISP